MQGPINSDLAPGMDDKRAIKAYNKKRNAMLKRCDPDLLIEFMREHDMPLPSSRASAEVTLHKTITGVVNLPLPLRLASKKWLSLRGLHSLDDGEL